LAPTIAAAAPLDTAAAFTPQHASRQRQPDRIAYEAAYRQSFLAIRRADMQMHQLFRDILDRANRHHVEAGDVVIMFDATEGGQSVLLNNGVWRHERAQRRKRAMVKNGLIVGRHKAGRYRYELTEQGRDALAIVNRALTAQSTFADQIGGLGIEALDGACQTCARAERLWIDIVRYKL
jgi:hypothetical protein